MILTISGAEHACAEIVGLTARIHPYWMNLVTIDRVYFPEQESRPFVGAAYSLVHSVNFCEGESRARWRSLSVGQPFFWHVFCGELFLCAVRSIT